MKDLLERINILLGKLKLIVGSQNLSTLQGQQIYQTALLCIGKDASPNDLAPDELGCAETVSDILIKAGFPMKVILSTAELYVYFRDNRTWLASPSPLAGDVIISPTGQGGQNGITHGHTGIVGVNGVIMSNSSATGTFEPNYTLPSWNKRYAQLGGYPVYFFRKVL